MEIELPIGTTRDLSLAPTSGGEPATVENVAYTLLPEEGDDSVLLTDNGDGTAKIKGLVEGDRVLKVTADAVLGDGVKSLSETHLVTVVPIADQLNLQPSDPYVENES